jgi:hypothetical protein
VNAHARALSVSRPWDRLILEFGKHCENRLWKTAYRGPLVVHAARSFDVEGLTAARYHGVDPAAEHFDTDAPVGFVGVVELVGIHPGPDRYALPEEPCDCGTWGQEGCWHWELARPRRFPRALAGRGMPGIFNPPVPVTDQARLWGLL